MYNKKTILDVDVNSKRVFLRCDFNVPVKDGKITDETRIIGALPTIKYLLDNKAKVILASHFGKPKEGYEKKYSLEPVAKRLEELLGKEVYFNSIGSVVDEDVLNHVNNMGVSEIMLLENTRFRKEEEKNKDEFSIELSKLADIYVNDAFGAAHRAHCSTAGITKYVDVAVSGFLIEKELKYLGQAVEDPKRPFVAILGGAKVSDKIDVINNLLTKVDKLIIGGGMAYTFLKAQGFEIGKSLLEGDKLEYALEMIKKAKDLGVELLLPVDHGIASEFKDVVPTYTSEKDIPNEMMGLDIGPKTIELFNNALESAKTVIWNGPMGVFEFENFNKGTLALAKTLSTLDATTVIGGGDSAAAVTQLGYADMMTHISTGGGASLEFLEGKDLPGISSLQDK
jgi:phosphoglycerate kinase